MAARLETSSRQYGVSVLASHFFYDLLSHEGQESMRRLDVVTVKGSEVPIGIYTYDTFQDQIFPGLKAKRQSSAGVSSRGSEQQLTVGSVELLTNATPTDEVFERDSDLLLLRAHVSKEFSSLFAEGVALYLSGDWPGARTLLSQADELMAKNVPALGGDKPSQTLLSYMADLGFTAPSSWKGYRPLTSK